MEKTKENNQTNSSRRSFLKFLGVASVSAVSVNATQSADSKASIPAHNLQYKMASIIDLGLCDGCRDREIPACVSACKAKNSTNFPEPIAEIPYYFPRKVYEDYSKNRENIKRLTPYNWTYVESLKVEDREIFVPRRCMHCDDPTCQKLCPFGVISKDSNGAVKIDDEYCFGGAKCRDVCPWGIPQRQAGVGIYLKIAPKLAGGGAMYKCDGCADLLAKNQKPACEVQCPKKAIIFGDREEILQKARALAQAYKGEKEGTYLYGDKQNGGTSTFYVSPVSFESIQESLNAKHNFTQEQPQKMGIPHMNLEIKNFVSEDSALIKSVLLAPLVGVVTGGIAVAKANKADKKESK